MTDLLFPGEWWQRLLVVLALLMAPLPVKVATVVVELVEATVALVAGVVAAFLRRRLPRRAAVAVAIAVGAAGSVGCLALCLMSWPFRIALYVWVICYWISAAGRLVRMAPKVWAWWRARHADPLPPVRDQIAKYADDVAAGRLVWPDVYAARVKDLHRRGLNRQVCESLMKAGDVRLLRQVESLDEWQIWWLNRVTRR